MPKLREPPKKDDEAIANDGNTALAGENEKQDAVVVLAPDDNADELRRQLEVLRKSENEARQQAQQATTERDQAFRYAQERNVALSHSQKEAVDSRLDSIKSGLATAEAEIEEAKNAFRMASIEQDIDAQVSAQERLAQANANKVNLLNGKSALERAIQTEQDRLKAQQQVQQQQPQGDALDRTNLPQTAKNWLRAHPDYMTDQRKNAKIQSLHWDVVDEGHAPFSDTYYESLEQHLGMRAKPRQIASEDDPEDEPRRVNVSAPVSREIPTSSGNRSTGTIRLTAAQREAAKMAGITEVEYGKQLVALNQAKANGSYGGQP